MACTSQGHDFLLRFNPLCIIIWSVENPCHQQKQPSFNKSQLVGYLTVHRVLPPQLIKEHSSAHSYPLLPECLLEVIHSWSISSRECHFSFFGPTVATMQKECKKKRDSKAFLCLPRNQTAPYQTPWQQSLRLYPVNLMPPYMAQIKPSHSMGM
ncbi:uncharacterized [Tachysurus ichikawai]